MTETAAPAESVFAFDEAYFHDPEAAHEALRAAGPVHRGQLPTGELVWLIVGYEHVRAAHTDLRLSLDKRHAGADYRGLSLPPALERNLLSLEGEDHARLRRLAAQALTPDAVSRLAPRIRATAQHLFARIEEDGGGDLIGDFSAPLTRTTLRALLGVPETQHDLFASHVATLTSSTAGPDQQRAAGGALLGLVTDVVARKRHEPDDDLISALIAARDGEDRLSEAEMLSLIWLLVMTGYETTAALIGSAALVLLGSDPADAGTIEDLIERTLRVQAPAPWSIRRFAVSDLTIGDATVRAGETVLLGLASANTDPLAPDAAGDARHLAFGLGVHYCLGAPLARLQVRIALSVIAAARERIVLAVPETDLSYKRSVRIRALDALPVLVGQAD